MHRFTRPFSEPQPTSRRPALILGLLVTGAFLGGCGGEETHDGHTTSRRAATSMILNVAPGEGEAAPMPVDELGVGVESMSGEGLGPEPSVVEADGVDVEGGDFGSVSSALTAGVGGALVLYDATGPFGALGELYGIGAANLVSHFGSWTAKRTGSYTCGELASFTALVYMGSTYDEPLPSCLLDDVLATTKPVLWSFYNVWQLSARAGGDAAFATRFGFNSLGLDFASVSEVRYKGRSLARYAANAAGIMNTVVVDPAKATVLAEAVRGDGTTFPWAMRSANFTYVGEIPFSYMSEEDRMLIYSDLLFDVLAPATVQRHRALVRIEDISADNDPLQLMKVADYLYSQRVPFGFGVVPDYRDPKGVYNSGRAQRTRLQDNPTISAVLKYLMLKGGVMVMHGQTHQWDTAINPYNQVSGDDYEFFRVTENADHTLTYQGPIPGDSLTWAKGRLTAADTLFKAAGLPLPAIFEFPHYSASATDYTAIASRFTTRWERTLYFNGLLTGTPVTYSRIFGQMFPYAVRDVYGTKVLPENLGNLEPTMFYQYPTRAPADIIRAAEKNLVVRDGFASFYFHPFFDLKLLSDTVKGIRALGYTFVSPAAL